LVMRAKKSNRKLTNQKELVQEILSYSLVGREGSEMLDVWMSQVKWPESNPVSDKKEEVKN